MPRKRNEPIATSDEAAIGDGSVKITLSVTNDMHKRIKAILSKERAYRGKITYFCADAIEHELMIAEGKAHFSMNKVDAIPGIIANAIREREERQNPVGDLESIPEKF